MEADAVERIGEGNDLLVRAFAHQADLNPVFPAQIFAVVTEEITGFLHRFAGFRRIHLRRQHDGDDGR